MKLKDMSQEDLEALSYTDLTALILEENKKSMNTPTIFKKICELLQYSEEDFANKIGDYYTSLTIDKRFVFLENNEWDLRVRHSVEIVLDEDELEEDVDEEEIDEELEEEIDLENTIDDIEEADELDDLSVLDEDELEEE